MLAVKCYKCGRLIEGVSRKDAVAAWRGKAPMECDMCKAAIYSDGVHLVTDGPELVLHKFASRLGLRRRWHQSNGAYPHYDLTSENKRAIAIEHGAVRVSTRELITLMRRAGKFLRKGRAAA